VAYICAEGAAGVSQRIRAWEIARGVQAPDDCRFLPEAVSFLDAAAVASLLSVILALPVLPVFIVVDTLARSMPGGEENGSKDMGTFIAAMDALRQTTGATVMTLHHVTNAGGDIRGHSSLLGALDTELKTSKGTGLSVTLACGKQKDAEEFKPITLRGRPITVKLSRRCQRFLTPIGAKESMESTDPAPPLDQAESASGAARSAPSVEDTPPSKLPTRRQLPAPQAA
jgi:hypothetical protein